VTVRSGRTLTQQVSTHRYTMRARITGGRTCSMSTILSIQSIRLYTCTQYRCTLYGFKIALKVFDCSGGRCPKYFGDAYTPVHTVAACSRLRSADHGDLVDQRTTETSSFHVCSPPDLAAAVFVCVVRQFATNFHRICEAQTPETV